jgi:hypothetical protein
MMIMIMMMMMMMIITAILKENADTNEHLMLKLTVVDCIW